MLVAFKMSCVFVRDVSGMEKYVVFDSDILRRTSLSNSVANDQHNFIVSFSGPPFGDMFEVIDQNTSCRMA